MSDFKSELIVLNPGDLIGYDIDFFEVDGYPVVYINNGTDNLSGAVALFGKPRTFPVESLLSYDGCQLSSQEFFKLFPETEVFFNQPAKQAA